MFFMIFIFMSLLRQKEKKKLFMSIPVLDFGLSNLTHSLYTQIVT